MRPPARLRTGTLLLPLILGACALPPACPAGTAPAAIAEVALGRSSAGRLRVTDAEWSAFLAEEATPRFPEGLTALDAEGQWRAPDGRIFREPSKLLLLVLPGASLAEAAARTEPLAEAYRARFAQESVLRSLRPSCAGF
ncbi:DUF3574 domain-containing protein [Muricoccus aerilatus]|uniref:DUF3574 domain-containing protein n=1 Tax=Muricoccus aerilatus TaxID=452982 RepID=UPI0006934C97|nr:DUF3574 domain-containing protein [Roseomonas aerilata]